MTNVKRYALNFCDRLEECKEGYLVYYDDYKALEEKYLALLAETRWIKVQDEMPPAGEMVIAFRPRAPFYQTAIRTSKGDDFSGSIPVTHWMRMPKNPE